MQPSDRPQFAELLGLLAETYDVPVSEARAEAYWLALLDLPLEAVRHAVGVAMRSLDWFPKPAQLRKFSGYAAPHEGEAWALLQQLKRITGASIRQPTMAPAMAMLVDRLGGWRMVMGLDDDELRRRFERTYAATATAAQAQGLAFDDAAQRAALTAPYRGPVLAHSSTRSARGPRVLGDVLAESLDLAAQAPAATEVRRG